MLLYVSPNQLESLSARDLRGANKSFHFRGDAAGLHDASWLALSSDRLRGGSGQGDSTDGSQMNGGKLAGLPRGGGLEERRRSFRGKESGGENAGRHCHFSFFFLFYFFFSQLTIEEKGFVLSFLSCFLLCILWNE